jgi:glucokinase
VALLGIDLGGTKLSGAGFTEEGLILFKESVSLENRIGSAVGKLVTDNISTLTKEAVSNGSAIDPIGISVPGISNSRAGTVWAPNIRGWEEYHLSAEVNKVTCDIPALIDNERACCILGEVWEGNATGCKDAVFLAVGTGMGAGILFNDEVLRGNIDIAGAIGWMALYNALNSGGWLL